MLSIYHVLGAHISRNTKKLLGIFLNAALCGPGRRELSSGAARDRFPLLFLALGCMHGGCPAGPVLPKWCRLEQK